ncbi:STAS domain-containing protein [Streptomyces beijiangensis]|uniref:STAS domain-containing protein n=1 Tax=Streptomyces beijiangensis TaxID=163361 RepID=A0A939JGQ4_9ACTN|nr:STAS domain-containing protein [Streptomyces beijiangensis]MBO0511340.1 STAS domain-containing protein [Streptomyces beijiangensis]
MKATEPLVLVITRPVTREDVPCLCEELRILLYGTGAPEVTCDVGVLTDPGLAAVEAIARLRLTARELGSVLRLRDVPPGLKALLDLVGLGDNS